MSQPQIARLKIDQTGRWTRWPSTFCSSATAVGRRFGSLWSRCTRYDAFHILELRGIRPRIRLGSTELHDLIVNATDAVLRVWVRAEKFRSAAALASLGFELLEELRHGFRVVSAVVENLCS